MTSGERAGALQDASASVRLQMIELHRRAGAGHLGSSLSIAELLTVIFAEHFCWGDDGRERDRFVLSKGHAAMGLYCALHAFGRIDRARLETFGTNGSPLEPHPNESAEPALDASTGSLGQGLSVGVGLALGSRMGGSPATTFVMIGDGEANEGQVWEAARSAATLKLANLVVVLDDNGMQQDGQTADIMPVSDLAESWSAMGWLVRECDGHACADIDVSLAALRDADAEAPRLLHARTVKGRGVPFLEGTTESHFPPPLSAEEVALARYCNSTPTAAAAHT